MLDVFDPTGSVRCGDYHRLPELCIAFTAADGRRITTKSQPTDVRERIERGSRGSTWSGVHRPAGAPN